MTTVEFHIETRHAAKAFEAMRDRNDLKVNWINSTVFQINTDGDIDELIDDVILYLMEWAVNIVLSTTDLYITDDTEYKYGMFGKYK